jgi:hypothetical protein
LTVGDPLNVREQFLHASFHEQTIAGLDRTGCSDTFGDGNGCLQRFRHPFALHRHHRDDGHAQQRAEASAVHLQAFRFRFVHHVQGDDHFVG